MLDTQGPEIRTGAVDEPVRLTAGQTLFLDVEPQPKAAGRDDAAASVQVNYPDLPTAVGVGDRVRLDNGLLNVYVVAREGNRLKCRVVDGGLLGSRKHVNLPGIAVNLPSITDKDRQDIAFGVEQEIDYVALSFVRSASDVAQLRDLLGPKGARTVKVVAKIENQEGVRNAEEIARAADGVMVARGEFGDRNRHRGVAERATAIGRNLRPARQALCGGDALDGVDDRQPHPHPRRGDRCG